MSTIVYKGITEGDWVVCSQCGKRIILHYGADQCPECYGWGTLDWADNDHEEVTIDNFKESTLEHSDRELKMEDYFDPDTLAIEYPDYYNKLRKENGLEEEDFSESDLD